MGVRGRAETRWGFLRMSNDDDVLYQSSSNRDQGRRRKQAVLGVVGLAALLGAGAYLVTAQIMESRNATVSGGTGALAPVVVPPSSPLPSASVEAPPATETTKSAVKQAFSPAPSLSVPASASLSTGPTTGGYSAQEVPDAGPVDERSENLPNGILRVVTARHDLTGQRELLWTTDRGRPVGDASCTQKFRFAGDQKASVRPNLLVCWRTSATRSVITVLVSRDGKPSTARSVKAIDREWARLG